MMRWAANNRQIAPLRRWLHAGLLGLAASGVLLARAGATGVSFSQQILPLDCVFTTINAGTGELYFITPQACGVYLPPSTIGSLSTVTAEVPTDVTGRQPNSPSGHSSILPSGDGSGRQPLNRLPVQPFAAMPSPNHGKSLPASINLTAARVLVTLTAFGVIGLSICLLIRRRHRRESK